MADSGVSAEFGKYLRGLREAHARLSLGAAVIRLRSLGINTGKSTLSRYESGERLSPDPVILWGLSTIYGEPLDRIVQTLFTMTTQLRRTAEPKTARMTIRLTEQENRELRLLQLFRSAATTVQKEIIELLEFKEGRRGADDDPKDGSSPPSRRLQRRRRSNR